MRPRLRLYLGEEHSAVREPHISVRLGEITRVLRDAIETDRAWLSDFENDEIQVPPDLYEVLTSYSHLRPGA